MPHREVGRGPPIGGAGCATWRPRPARALPTTPVHQPKLRREVPFRWFNDDEYAVQAAYYRLPHLAVRSLVWGQMQVPRPEPVEAEDTSECPRNKGA